MLNTFEETFEVTEMRTFKHEAFFIVGGGGGGGLIRGTLRYVPNTVNILIQYQNVGFTIYGTVCNNLAV